MVGNGMGWDGIPRLQCIGKERTGQNEIDWHSRTSFLARRSNPIRFDQKFRFAWQQVDKKILSLNTYLNCSSLSLAQIWLSCDDGSRAYASASLLGDRRYVCLYFRKCAAQEVHCFLIAMESVCSVLCCAAMAGGLLL